MIRGLVGVIDPSGVLTALSAALRHAGFTIIPRPLPGPTEAGAAPGRLDVLLTADWPAGATSIEPVVAILPEAGQAAAIAEGAADAWPAAINPRLAIVRLDGFVARRTAEAARSEAESRTAALPDGSSDGMWVWDQKSGDLILSARACEQLGLVPTQSLTSESWLDRIHQDDRAPLWSALESVSTGGCAAFEVDHRVRSQTGPWRWLRARGAPARDSDGRPTGGAGSLTDVTAIRGTDPVTGLPNNERFREALTLAMERARRRSGTVLGVARVTLEDWPALRAQLGPLRTEPILREAGAALVASLRAVDTVARFGDSEFAVLMEHVDSPRNALVVARRLVSALGFPVESDEGPKPLGAAIGLATTGPGCSDVDELLAEAGSAMVRAREHGTGVELFDHVAHCRATERLELESDLTDALRDGLLTVAYQAVIELATGALSGFEALVRWTSARHGVVPPSTFVPVAEETGLIDALGVFVLRTAANQLRVWSAMAGDWDRAPLSVSVNVSPKQLAGASLIPAIQAILEETGIPASALTLEITESVFIDDRIAAVSRLASLRAIGVSVAIDDFGTGHSTLAYLRELPATILKIDQSFVRPIEPSTGRPDFVRSLVLLAHELGLVVVAEGVETAADAIRLAALGCDYGQGYHFSEPLSPDAATALLTRSRLGPDPTATPASRAPLPPE